jgi:chromate transporter
MPPPIPPPPAAPPEAAPDPPPGARPPDASGTHPPAIPFTEALAFWLKLGFISFGGPAGQIALMHEHLVERRRWISEKRFLHALNYCMLLPGPEAQQLATYLGWLMHRGVGGILAGLLFVLPSFLLIALIAWGYMVYGDLPVFSGALDGIKPAVVALVLVAGWRIGTRTLRGTRLWLIAVGAFVCLHLAKLPFPLVILAAAAIGWIATRAQATAALPQGADPARAARGADSAASAKSPQGTRHALIDDDTPPPAHARARPLVLFGIVAAGLVLWTIGWLACTTLTPGSGTLVDMAQFFTQAALLTFGGAYAVLPYVHQAAVEHYGWLTAPQMLDALALGETTPGPLIMIVAFVGFVGGWTQQIFGAQSLAAAGWAAAFAATFFTFLPSFIFILAGGPLVESTRSLPRLDAALTAITAAVVGVMASLALILAQAVIVRPGSGAIDSVALIGIAVAWWLLARRKWPVITTIALFAGAGVALRLAGLR